MASRLYYLCDESGTLRWAFPDDAVQPFEFGVLRKAPRAVGIQQALGQLAFRLGVRKGYVSGCLELSLAEMGALSSLQQLAPHSSFSIYLNAEPAHEKQVVALNQKKITTHIVKIARSRAAFQRLHREAYALEILGQRQFRHLQHAELQAFLDEQVSVQNNIKPARAHQPHRLQPLHLLALRELYDAYWHRRKLRELPLFGETEGHLNALFRPAAGRMMQGDEEIMLSLKALLFTAWQSFQPPRWLDVSLGHGNFIPANMYMGKRQLYVFDWEAAEESRPLLFDVFDFIHDRRHQGQKQAWKASMREWQRVLRMPVFQQLVHEHQLDPHALHQLYLVQVAARELHALATEGQPAPHAASRLAYWHAWMQALMLEQVQA